MFYIFKETTNNKSTNKKKTNAFKTTIRKAIN